MPDDAVEMLARALYSAPIQFVPWEMVSPDIKRHWQGIARALLPRLLAAERAAWAEETRLAVAAARAEERERAAMVAENAAPATQDGFGDICRAMSERIAAAIRATTAGEGEGCR